VKEEKRGGKEEQEGNDIYRRKKRLEYWIRRLKSSELDEQSKEDVLDFLEYLRRADVGELRCVRYLTALILLLLWRQWRLHKPTWSRQTQSCQTNYRSLTTRISLIESSAPILTTLQEFSTE
jgi:hypothetical protein